MVSTALWFSSALALTGATLAETAEPASPRFPLGVAASMDTSLGAGTFASGPAARPYANLHWSLRPFLRLDTAGEVTARARLDVGVNVVENADSTNTYPNQVQFDDLELRLRHERIARLDAAWLTWSGDLAVFLPTSRLSQLTSKLLGVRAGLDTTFAPLPWLSLQWSCRFTKNFNAFDGSILQDAGFDRGPAFRAGGAERVASGITATGKGVTSFALENGWSLTFTLPKGFSVLVDFTLLNAWSAQSQPKDQYSSAHAVAGRGRTDLMYGTLELGWEPLPELSLGLGTLVEQAPKTDDNRAFRFPFWDTTNGAANRQVFYLSATMAL